MSDQGKRLRRAFKAAGYKSAAAFADALGIKEVTLRQQINRASIPPDAAEMYVRRTARVGTTLEWLLFNKGPGPGDPRPLPPGPRQIRGDMPRRAPPEETVEVQIHHFIGAGDEVHMIDGDSGFDYTEAPPGYGEGGAGIVRGHSMLPLFDDGDVLFWKHLTAPPREPPRRAVIAELADNRLFVKKLLPGTKRGRFHLLSVNPVMPTMQDCEVTRIARIGWVKPTE